MVPIDCITFHFIFSQLSSRLMIFGWQKQASCGWQLYLFTLYYPQYNLAAKSNYLTFFSKINCFDGIIKITDTLHTINKAINQCEKHYKAKVKSLTSHGSFRSHPPFSNACLSHSNPFPHLQCISTKFPFTLTPCQITAAAYDWQKHIFPYRAWKCYSVGFSYMSNTLSSR